MANDFANTDNSQGLLKDATETSPLQEALRRKRKKLAETKGIETEDDDGRG